MKIIICKTFLIVFSVFLFTQCKKVETHVKDDTVNVIQKLRNDFFDSNGKNIMVIAHRGDWRNAPENSIQAIKNCIDMGVDIVEVDVRKTKDNQLVIIHDRTLDRTTNGKGLVSDWTLDSLKTLRLMKGVGVPTSHKIPTLREALLVSKGKILINLDKCYDYFDEAYKIIEETGMANQVIIKGFNKPVNDVLFHLGNKKDSIIFMPVINLDKIPNASLIIDEYQMKMKVKAIELVFSKDSSDVLNKINEIKQKGSRIWVNSLWGSLNAYHGDDMAVINRDSIYGWYVQNEINMIQTDRPQFLLDFLRSQGLHK